MFYLLGPLGGPLGNFESLSSVLLAAKVTKRPPKIALRIDTGLKNSPSLANEIITQNIGTIVRRNPSVNIFFVRIGPLSG
jgi:hypothetical protein